MVATRLGSAAALCVALFAGTLSASPASADVQDLTLASHAVSSATGGSITYVVEPGSYDDMWFFQITWPLEFGQGFDWTGWSDCPSALSVTVDGTPWATDTDWCSGGEDWDMPGVYTWFGQYVNAVPVGSTVVIAWDDTLLTTPDTPGTYDVGVWFKETGTWNIAGRQLMPVTIGGNGASTAAIPIWHQGIGRAGADAACESGWSPSWELWPNGNQGGFVCVRDVFMYSPS